MTTKEAQEWWEEVQAYSRSKVGASYREPSTHERNAYLYECLSGDGVYRTEMRELEKPAYRLHFWTDKFRTLRGVNSELDAFLINQINAARRGDAI